MTKKNYKALFRAGLYLNYTFYKNLRLEFLTFIISPYLFWGMILVLGYIFGSSQAFSKKVGAQVDPVMFYTASVVIASSSMNIMYQITGSVIFMRWSGTLSYHILSPYRMSTLFIILHIPRYLLRSTISILSFVPPIIFMEGLYDGITKIAILFLAMIVGMLPLLGFSVILASILLIIREQTNVFNWLSPLILIFSGAYYPAYLLPKWAQFISKILPTTYTLELARTCSIIGSPNINQIVFMIALLLGITCLYNGASFLFVGKAEKIATKHGVFE